MAGPLGPNLLGPTHVTTVIVHVLRGRANMAHVRQSGPDSGQVKVLTTFEVFPSSLASHIHEDGPQHVTANQCGVSRFSPQTNAVSQSSQCTPTWCCVCKPTQHVTAKLSLQTNAACHCKPTWCLKLPTNWWRRRCEVGFELRSSHTLFFTAPS